jgi:hypothetical protein
MKFVFLKVQMLIVCLNRPLPKSITMLYLDDEFFFESYSIIIFWMRFVLMRHVNGKSK